MEHINLGTPPMCIAMPSPPFVSRHFEKILVVGVTCILPQSWFPLQPNYITVCHGPNFWFLLPLPLNFLFSRIYIYHLFSLSLGCQFYNTIRVAVSFFILGIFICIAITVMVTAEFSTN